MTTARREFSGLLDGYRDNRLFIRTAREGGEVGYSFAPAEIEKLTLPGADLEAQATELWDRGIAAEALPMLEALGRQRLRYLPVLTDEHRRPLWLLVRASMRAGNPLVTIGYVNQLRPVARSAEERTLLRDAELDAHVKLGRVDDIRRLASEWCAASDPAGSSALGWKILAQLAYDGGDFPRARWIALQPVVFSGYLPMEHLETCYALAISAAHKLGDARHAAALFHDLQSRQLQWPLDPKHADIGRHYAELAAKPAAPAVEINVDTPASDPAAPATPPPDRNHSLDQVRKLTSPPPAR